jgi:Ca2+-binding RTX toxin-like protein
MKRAGIFLTLISVLVFVFAGVALAAVINGNNGNNNLVGTPRADHIRGFGGNDTLRGRGGEDELMGGTGNDYINCGPGNDRARANPGDDIKGGSCEKVIRAGQRVGGGGMGA